MSERREMTRLERWTNIGMGSAAGAAVLALFMGTYGAHIPLSAAGTGASPAAASAATSAADTVIPRAAAVDSYADLVSRVAPAVVTVRSTKTMHQTQMPSGGEDLLRRFFGGEGRDDSDFRSQPRRQAGLGSGVVVREDGYILTNHHVVDSADKVRVDFTDGRSFEAQIVGVDRPSDLAVLKIAARSLPTLPLGNSDRARVGDVVLAIGNPLGIGQTVTMGIVSGKGRATGASQGAFEDFIQTDAPINQGNSGGALLNLKGELIGINSQILSPVGYNIGIGFAIPSNMAQNVMEQLITKGSVRRGMLGVTVQGLNPDLAKSVGLSGNQGAIVTDVTKDGPAAHSGIQRGDVIMELNGQLVDSSNSLRNLVARLDPGSPVTLKVWRDGSSREMTAKLGELPTDKAAADEEESGKSEKGRFGMRLQSLTPDIAKQLGADVEGVLVADVDPDGPAAEAGVQSGDVIVQVDNKATTSIEAVKSALAEAKGDKPVLLLVNRRGSHLFLTMTPA